MGFLGEQADESVFVVSTCGSCFTHVSLDIFQLSNEKTLLVQCQDM